MMILKITYNLYKLRMQAGLTQRQLAERAGVGHATISDIENGKKQPTVYTMCLLAFALNVKFKDLVNITVYKN